MVLPAAGDLRSEDEDDFSGVVDMASTLPNKNMLEVSN